MIQTSNGSKSEIPDQELAFGIPLRPVLIANPLCPGWEKRTMCELAIQIANCGEDGSALLSPASDAPLAIRSAYRIHVWERARNKITS
jgi:hypothetical protein